jgi:hypothetical protein
MAKAAAERAFEASRERIYAASLRAISQMGKSVTNSDVASGTVSYNTGMSMRSMAGQDMTVTVFAEGPDQCRVVVGGTRTQRGNIGGGGQLFDWGERGKMTRKFFEALDIALQHTPEPTASPTHSEAKVEELERLAALHSSGALDDQEFQAAKAKLLG